MSKGHHQKLMQDRWLTSLSSYLSLVTTTMDVDTGLVRKLPAMPEEEEILDDSQIKARNIYVVLVNSKDQLLVEEELMDISQLREGAKSFR